MLHYKQYDNFPAALTGFSQYCRENELSVGLNHTHEALRMALNGFAFSSTTMKYAARALYCTSKEDQVIFDRCFELFWGERRHRYAHKLRDRNRSNVTKNSNASLVLMGFQANRSPKEEEQQGTKNVSGASKIEALKKTDFTKISSTDTPLLDEITNQLLKQLNHRLRRRLNSSKKGKVDIRKTMRKNLSHGDLLIHLARRNRKVEKYRMVVLLDVSGSMDKYSFYLLRFIWSLKSNLKNIEAFVFSTHLTRITDLLHKNKLDQTLWQMSQHTDNWSGGTKIGECLKTFNEQFAKRVLNGKSLTIILSDGLEHGTTALLSHEMEKIRARTKKLAWLNPLKGMSGYQPVAGGMKAALPYIDQFESAHNLESLVKLEKILADV